MPACLHACGWAGTWAGGHARACVQAHACVHARSCVRACACVAACVRACMYMRAYTHARPPAAVVVYALHIPDMCMHACMCAHTARGTACYRRVGCRDYALVGRVLWFLIRSQRAFTGILRNCQEFAAGFLPRRSPPEFSGILRNSLELAGIFRNSPPGFSGILRRNGFKTFPAENSGEFRRIPENP